MVTATGPVPDVALRLVRAQDLEACHALETASFPPSEAASRGNIAIRIARFPQGFLVAEKDGAVVGHVNSGATHKEDIADEAFKALVGHDPQGRNAVIFSLAVAEAWRGRGVAGMLLCEFKRRMHEQGREGVLLLCKENLCAFYARYGFVDRGLSASRHGGVCWHEMHCSLATD